MLAATQPTDSTALSKRTTARKPTQYCTTTLRYATLRYCDKSRSRTALERGTMRQPLPDELLEVEVVLPTREVGIFRHQRRHHRNTSIPEPLLQHHRNASTPPHPLPPPRRPSTPVHYTAAILVAAIWLAGSREKEKRADERCLEHSYVIIPIWAQMGYSRHCNKLLTRPEKRHQLRRRGPWDCPLLSHASGVTVSKKRETQQGLAEHEKVTLP